MNSARGIAAPVYPAKGDRNQKATLFQGSPAEKDRMT